MLSALVTFVFVKAWLFFTAGPYCHIRLVFFWFWGNLILYKPSGFFHVFCPSVPNFLYITPLLYWCVIWPINIAKHEWTNEWMNLKDGVKAELRLLGILHCFSSTLYLPSVSWLRFLMLFLLFIYLRHFFR